MLVTRRQSYKHHLFEASLVLIGLLFFCEYIIYYIVLFQCGWPHLDARKVDPTIPTDIPEEKPVRAMFLADTHLLGPKNGHWFDKLKREWQMYRTFQTAMVLHKPEVIFILGDIFDEGSRCSEQEFERYIQRFHAMFFVPKNTHLYVVAGNHDMGFHYAVTPYLNERFINGMNAPSVRRITIRGNHFILVNSMALEGDGCFLCRSTEITINKISRHLKCAKGIDSDCSGINIIKKYSRPILLQHYPLYRESDKMCNEIDEAPAELKATKFRERWEVLAREASDQLLDTLQPRLVVDGHTHHGCTNLHRDDILELTLPSFNWRNKDNPSYLLGVFTPNNYALSKCYMPVESTVIMIYIVVIIIYAVFKIKQKMHHTPFTKRLL